MRQSTRGARNAGRTGRPADRRQPAGAARDTAGRARAEAEACALHSERAAPPRPETRKSFPPPIGGRLRDLRQRRGMTLSDVEGLSGISKSMLSQIERGKVNPTFATLWNLTQSLEVGISELLQEVSLRGAETRPYEHVTVELTPIISNQDGLSFTRVLSPRRYPHPVEWYEMVLEPGGARRANPHGNGSWENLTVIVGEVVVEIGDSEVAVSAGETVRYSGDQPHGVRNDKGVRAHAVLVVVPYPEPHPF